MLLTALGITVSGWTKNKTTLINLEGHGREQIGQALDITRTIGWFTCQYPVEIDINQDDDLSTQIKRTKEQLRRIPQKGIGYGILKYLTKEGRDKLHVEPEISFNYLGEFGQTHKSTFALSPIKTGRDISLQNCMPYALDINGYVEEGRLTVHFGYNRKEYYRETISNLASGYKAKLETIIGHCLQKEEVELTPADLGYKDITLDELGELENDLMDVS